jgi:bacillithiol synthase
VLSQPVASSTQNKFAVDIRRFPWIRRLASDYAFDFGRLAEFFNGNPSDPAAWRDAIARSQRHPYQRGVVAGLIGAQQKRRGAPPEAIAASGQLRDPSAVAIVTGQQAGLFGGPLFTLLKAVTALRLANQVRSEHGVPVVAIFWIDSEDHDWDEVRSCGTLDPEQTPRKISLSDMPGANHGPVASVRLDDAIEAAISELGTTLQTTEFTSDLLDQLRRAYAPGHGMAEAFGRWLESVLGPHGLVVYDASDPSAKVLAADLFAREVERPGETARLATEAGTQLVAAGYHAQVTSTPNSVALFHLNNGRHAIQHDGSAFVVGDERVSREDLVARIRQRPETFSPNVLLRPLVQDTLFPTVCYVAGPNELAYLAQLREVYSAFGIPMPLMHQRATATIVDSNAMKFLSRHNVDFESLRAQDEGALNELLKAQLPATVEASVHDALSAIEQRMADVAREVTLVDATLEGATRSTLTRMQDDVKKLHAKIIQAAKRKDETLKRQFHHARSLVFPGGHPQEREIGFVYFLNKYGPALIDRLADDLPIDMGQHWVITV